MPVPPFKKKKPAHLLNEEDVKKMLGIADFRNVTKDQVVQIVSSLSQMDPEVAMKVIEQIPDLADTALGMAKEVREGYVEALHANDKSAEAALARIDMIIKILSEELEKDELTPEERIRIIDCLKEIADKPVELHKLDQEFMMKGLTIVAGVAVMGLAGIAVILGANGKLELPNLQK